MRTDELTAPRAAAVAGGSARALGLSQAGYVPHRLHALDTTWSEINCSVDLWIELLHALGHEPVAAAAFVVAAGFEGDQWRFLKYPAEDIRELYGIAVDEINVWRPLPEHALEQLSRGCVLTVEVDAYWLPDLLGTSYRTAHTKTTIGVESIDVGRRQAAYFHGSGYWTLADEDFDGVFGWVPGGDRLAPYVERITVRAGSAAPEPAEVREIAWRQLRRYASMLPAGNPVVLLGERLAADLPWIASLGLTGYHGYAFGGLRQCGSGAGLLAALLDWLDPADAALAAAAASFQRLSESAKSLQFSLARVARGRSVDVAGGLAEMADAWRVGTDLLVARLL